MAIAQPPKPSSPKPVLDISVLELVLAILLMGGLIVMAESRSRPLQREAERIAVNRVLDAVAFAIRYENLRLRNQAQELLRLQGGNPFDKILTPPKDKYLGTITDASAKVPKGYWFYDKVAGEFGYQPHFARSEDPRGQLRFSLLLDYKDTNFNQRYDAEQSSEILRGIKLGISVNYVWD